MRLTSIRIQNYRSIVDSCEFRIERLQVFVGENNAGKSNLLRGVDAFLSAGAGGITVADFFDKSKPIVFTVTFTGLRSHERKLLRKYLLGDKLILEKRLQIEGSGQKEKIDTEYHGYIAEPVDWWLSIEKVLAREGQRPRWEQIAIDNGIIEYVRGADGRVNKASYEAGVRRLLEEREDIRFEEPTLGATQALGRQTTLLEVLPSFYLLPAITDYSNEIDKRASSTVFRQLMGDLGERLLRTDPRYDEIEASLAKIRSLLNEAESPAAVATENVSLPSTPRLNVMAIAENALKSSICKLMPSVHAVKLRVVVEDSSDFFSRGVELKVDDGVLTDVLVKGHGLQRCVVFGLLQTLIQNVKGTFAAGTSATTARPIILGIEEPELYIHPQLQRRVYQVLREFVGEAEGDDQVIFTTHAPAFVDVTEYQNIGVVRKEATTKGTRIHQSVEGVLGTVDEQRGFKLLTTFGLDHNRLFFARRSILVEGEQDEIAIIAGGRKARLFSEFPEEIDYSVIVTGCKEEIPKFQKLLNAFELPYIVLLELDGKPDTDGKNADILKLLNGNRCVRIPQRLEDLVGHTGHFGNSYRAARWFQDSGNLTPEWQERVNELFASGGV
ncbi:MAG: hypothetical protein AMXMBFR47_00020 [Planctomycetota bacterium]